MWGSFSKIYFIKIFVCRLFKYERYRHKKKLTVNKENQIKGDVIDRWRARHDQLLSSFVPKILGIFIVKVIVILILKFKFYKLNVTIILFESL